MAPGRRQPLARPSTLALFLLPALCWPGLPTAAAPDPSPPGGQSVGEVAAAGGAPPASWSNYSLPYTVYYNNGGNYYSTPTNATFAYPPPTPQSFGFVADDAAGAAMTVGTDTFDFSGDPAWPNLIFNPDTKNYSWSAACPKPGVRTASPLGPLCCAPGGCIAQSGNLSAAAALTVKHVEAMVSPELAGNCVIDFEGWNSVVFGNQYGSCPSGPPQDPDDPPPVSNIQRDLSIALAREAYPHLTPPQLLEEGARARGRHAARRKTPTTRRRPPTCCVTSRSHWRGRPTRT